MKAERPPQSHGGEEQADLSILSACETYDPATDAWQPLPSLPFPLFYAALTVLGNQLLLIGGSKSESRWDSLGAPLRYAEASNAWVPFAAAVGEEEVVGFFTSACVL